jgi:hypothetical protein
MRKFRAYFWSTGEPWNSVRSYLLPRLLRLLHSLLMATLRISTSGVARSNALLDKETGVVFVTWHDLTLMPLHLFRHKGIGVMMSTSHSGQIQAAFWRLYGWPTTWGSTNKREGIRALREVLRLLREGRSLRLQLMAPKARATKRIRARFISPRCADGFAAAWRFRFGCVALAIVGQISFAQTVLARSRSHRRAHVGARKIKPRRQRKMAIESHRDHQ